DWGSGCATSTSGGKIRGCGTTCWTSRGAWKRSRRLSAPARTCSAPDASREFPRAGRSDPVAVMTHTRREALNALLVVLGILSAAMGLKGFLLSSNFIDGGVTGVSMLLSKLTSAPLAVWLPLVNAPFVVVGYRQMGRAFAVRSALAIGGLAGALATIHVPDVTPDLLLTA